MKISVVIPVYNAAPYLRVCLDSVLAAAKTLSEKCKVKSEECAGVEVICVDDGSTDGSGKFLDEHLHSSNSTLNFDCKVIHQPNAGEGAARNAGLSVATGEWVTFLDSDDVWLSNMLTEFVGMARRHSDADIIGLRFLPFEDGHSPPAARMAAEPEQLFDIHCEIPSEAIFGLGVFPTFFRREKFRDIAFSSLPLGADRLYVAQCLAKADLIAMSSAVVHGYRVREGSMARAVWDDRKIRSMIDFASGSLAAFSASGKLVGRRGAAYLGDVLLTVTPKQIRRMSHDRTEVRRYWLNVLSSVDGRFFTPWQRVRRWLRCNVCRSI